MLPAALATWLSAAAGRLCPSRWRPAEVSGPRTVSRRAPQSGNTVVCDRKVGVKPREAELGVKLSERNLWGLCVVVRKPGRHSTPTLRRQKP